MAGHTSRASGLSRTVDCVGTAPAALLIKLEPGREIAAGSVRGLGKEVAALVEAGWISARRERGVMHVQLTEAGVAERARVVAEAPPARASRSRTMRVTGATSATRPATPSARLAALDAAVAALTARVAALEGRGRAPAPPPIDPAALRTALIGAIGDVDAGTRAGGLVPIPALRAELRRRGIGADDGDVTAALEALEREWLIDLSIAQDPGQVADRAAGIERPGRGLLYYVARR